MLEKVDIHLVDHCNLKCKSCTHFSPLADELYINLDNFEADLKRCSILSNGNGFKQIFLLGGEPLLHPQITDFFPVTRNLFRNSIITVITNGILLSEKDDNFWKACRRSGVEIWVSDYKLNLPYDEINAKAKSFDVFLGYTSTAVNGDNKKAWAKFPLDIEGKQYYTTAFNHCSVKNCVTLKNGKLYTCPTIAHIEHFNKHFNLNLEPSEYDFVDIYKATSWEEIENALVKPVSFCRFCKTQGYETTTWGPTAKELNEWT